MNNISVLRKLRSGLKIVCERGFFEFLKELSKKIYFQYRANLYVYDLIVSDKKHFCEDEHVKIVTNRFDETIDWLVSLNIPGLANPYEIENIRNKGHLIYTLLVNNLVAGCIKVGKGKVFISDFKTTFIFPQDSAFIMDSFIHPVFRGKKLFHPLISRVINDLKEAGYRHLYCHIRIDNLPSIAAYGKSGFKKIAGISYKKMLWKQAVDLPTDFLDALIIINEKK